MSLKLRILVFMTDNRKIEGPFETATYNSLTAAINYEYCKQNNYDFIYYRTYLANKNSKDLYNCVDPNTKELRHASWSKLLTTKAVLEMDYDYVVYIDTDCIFKGVHINKTIEDYIEPYKDKDVIFLDSQPWYCNLPCAGFYICKVNTNTKMFINEWYNTNFPENNTGHFWEQSSLWNIYTKYNIAIVDEMMFFEEHGQMLRHINSGTHTTHRIPYFQYFIISHEIDFETNLKKIKYIDFDTSS
jgi:hypothetical protein